MPLDPLIANPATIKLADPMEQYGSFLKNAYLQDEIAKMKATRDDDAAYNAILKDSVNADGTYDRGKTLGNFAKSGQGKQIPKLEEHFAKLDKTASDVTSAKALALKNVSLAGKADVDAFKIVNEELKNRLDGINVSDPAEGLKQYINGVKDMSKNPHIARMNASMNITPDQFIANETEQATQAYNNKQFPDFILRHKAGLAEATKQNITKVTATGPNGKQQNLVATPEHMLPGMTAEVVPGSTQNYVAPDHSTKIYMPANDAEKEYDKVRGEAAGKEDAALHTAAQNAQHNYDTATKIKALVKAGAITGAGAAMKIDTLALGKALGMNVPDNQLVASQMLQKYLAQNVFTAVGQFKDAGVPMNRLTNLDLTLTKEGTPRIELDSNTIMNLADDMIEGTQEAVRRNNKRNHQLRGNPKLGETTKMLSMEDDIPVPGGVPGATSAGVNPVTGKPWPIPPKVNQDRLRANPGERAIFEKHYGPAAAAQILGGQPGGGGAPGVAPTLPNPAGGSGVSPVFQQPLAPVMQEHYQPAPVHYRHDAGASQWGPVVDAASRQTGVPAGIIEAVINAESNGNPGVTSPAGAQGLMQLMPGTATGLGVHNAFDPVQNVLGGATYLRKLYDKFGNWRDAVAAYNAGPDHTEAAPGKKIGPFAKSHDDPRYRVWENPQNGGYAETRNYVSKIEQYLRQQQEKGYGGK